MIEQSHTCSSILSFAQKLEEDFKTLYETLARRYLAAREMFLGFSEESEKNKILVKRTYQETISDALEACYSLEGMKMEDFALEKRFRKDTGYSNALKMSIEFERKAANFYLEAADVSLSLLATIPGTFRKVAKNRKTRIQKLQSLLNNLE